jgi:glycosyltransferase involved in cell wall biosynthesis
MRHALLLAQRFDKRDGRLLRIREALREAGYSVTSLAVDSGGEARRDAETKDLRPRAIGLLMLASQLIMAAIIAGYFARFYPVLMTISFWTLIITAIGLTSPFGRVYRNAMIARLCDGLGQVETSKTGFDLVWAVDPESLRLATRIAKRDSARLVFDAHEFHREEAPDDEARRTWVIREEEAAAAHIDQWVTINDSIAKLYADAIPGSHPVVIRNAVDPQEPDRLSSPLRQAAGAGPEDHVLLYHGALRSLRYLPELVAAANALPANWKLVILGDGLLKPDLVKVDSPTVFLDPVPYEDLPEWIAGADLGVILYEDVGLNQHYCSPNKLYEYIAAGVPLMTSDLPEVRRFAIDQGCGLVVSADITAKRIAAAINDLTQTDLADMRAACTKTARTLSWTEEKAKLIALVSA